MSIYEKTKKINLHNLAPYIAISFAVGFVISGIVFFVIFCEDCEKLYVENKSQTIEEKCLNDQRCIVIDSTDSSREGIVTPIGKEKTKLLQILVKDPIIQQALKESNDKNSRMSEDIRIQIFLQREKEWISTQEIKPFMHSIINNDVSNFLRDNLVIQSEQFEHVTFGEHILTNQYGANVAVSVKTDNYDQSQDDWWQLSFRDEFGLPFARECEFDSSAGIFSEDIIIKINDENTGEFIGILNSATPCDVTEKSSKEMSRIEPVSLDNITEIGNYKISYLQKLVNTPIIQNSLELSNQEFSAMNEADISKLKKVTEWPKPGISIPTDLQISILDSKTSTYLKDNLKTQVEKFNQIQFHEMILTNSKGVTVASTDRTYNYIHSENEWWQVASQNDVLIRQCGPDKSINMNSEDIIIKIFDDKGKFVGILNSATQCDVVKNKPLFFYGDSN